MELKESILQLTHDNGAVKDLRDLIKLTVFNDPALDQFFTTVRNVHNGDKLGFLGAMTDIAWAGAGCSPEYKNPAIEGAEKEWKITDWEAPLYWCYKEFEATIAEYALKTGTDIADLTGTQIMTLIIQPALQKALQKAYWRMVWFGDTDAKNISASGVIKNGVDVNLFKTNDGVFKALFALATASPAQYTAIPANAKTTRADQFAEIRKPGVATTLVDTILMNADSRIAGLPGSALFVTKSIADALANDIKAQYHDIMPWQVIFDGVRLSTYNGVPVISMDIWDRMIEEYQSDGTKLNLPHRAFYGSPSQILVGTPAESLLSEFDVWFEQKDRKTYAYATGKLGTLLGEDELFQVAY